MLPFVLVAETTAAQAVQFTVAVNPFADELGYEVHLAVERATIIHFEDAEPVRSWIDDEFKPSGDPLALVPIDPGTYLAGRYAVWNGTARPIPPTFKEVVAHRATARIINASRLGPMGRGTGVPTRMRLLNELAPAFESALVDLRANGFSS